MNALSLDPPDIMTADDVADFLRLDRKTVYTAAARGDIPCRRLGRRLLFLRRALEDWLHAQPRMPGPTRIAP